MNPRHLADGIGKGLVAGLAGTAAMTVSSTIEMKMRGRPASSAPATAAKRVLNIEPQSEQAEARLATLTHWGYGTGWGVARGLLGALGAREPWGTMGHFALVWGAEMVMLPSLGIAPPAWKWGAQEVGIDAWHHVVYATATGLAYDALDRL